ncbi:MAG TPA: rod shape-determining protein MreC [Rectinemataceae bacterium]|nr:rod shape-determining protein MreC [Rectinemataceae bacterium]
MPQKKRSRGILATQRTPLLLIAASLLMISISTRSILNLPGTVASAVTGGVQYVFSSVGGFVKRTIFSIGELADLRNQYDTLADKLKAYETLQRNFADMMSENARLKEQLGFAQNMTTIKASAQIIAKDPGNIYSSYIIDKGLVSGIAKNMAVAAFQNGMQGLAGKILDARTKSSVVLPVFDQRFFVSARLSRTRNEGLVNGQGNPDDPLVMRYVSKLNAAEIQIGDMVVTSGLDSIYPSDLAIGRVKEIQLPEYSSSAIILLEPSLNFSKLEYLFVIQKAEGPSLSEPGANAAAPEVKAQR